MHFASFLSGGFTTMAVINPTEKKLANPTSVRWLRSSSLASSRTKEVDFVFSLHYFVSFDKALTKCKRPKMKYLGVHISLWL